MDDDFSDYDRFCPLCGEDGECGCTPQELLLHKKRMDLIQLQHEIQELEGTPSLEWAWDNIDGYSNLMFADPGGESALIAEFPGNPRIYDCPQCGAHNRLTLIDVHKGYCCNACARRNEGWGD